jgi:hypothetical protein
MLEPLERFILQSNGSIATSVDDLPPSVTAKMPEDWGQAFGHDFLGRVRYTRTFNRPTNLEILDPVWLVIEPPRTVCSIQLNGKYLGDVRAGSPAGRFDIRQFLKEHNSLQLVVEHPELDQSESFAEFGNLKRPGGLVCEVRLELEE